MRLVFMGSPGFALPALEALAARHEIAAVYTQPPRPAGRGQQPRPCPVAARAAALGLAVHAPASLREPAVQAAFAGHGAEAAVVAAYGLILPPAVLAAPPRGCLNIHASLLPRWRGAAPIHRAVIAGDAVTGISIMRMEAGLDTGPVLLAEATPVGAVETAGELHDRLAVIGARLILSALAQLDSLVARPQGEAGVTYAGKITNAEARVDWHRPAAEVDRLVRGLAPAPGAWTEAAGGRLRLLRSRPADGHGVPGEVLQAGPGGLVVACGDGAVAITEAQREGRRAMAVAELLRGLPLAPGDRLGAP
ncbi:MAG: methionyl-tRNA formyltransferase [Rhodobacteraceae bacterium]|jgi:methionyl-tRNA formyltransferase|nr:methionyl-tRNA formyltransferase [Paracoccaceae bacterium]